MSAENDENATAIDGILPLFEGQKNYPQLKITVDYSIVEHCEHNCIEVIGICLPAANPTGGRNSTTTPASTEIDGEQKTPPSIVRLYVNAEDFYSKVTADKKALDKKNRRPEQSIPIRSKLMRNMVAQSLLGAMSLMKSESNGFDLNMPPLDGKQFDTPKPPAVVPFDAPGLTVTPTIVPLDKRRSSSFLAIISGGLFGATVENVQNDAAELEGAADKAKEAGTMFNNALDSINEMFEMKQKYKDENGLSPVPVGSSKGHKRIRNRRSMDGALPGESSAEVIEYETPEKVRKGRFSLIMKPQPGVNSLEECQDTGREGPGAAPLHTVVANQQENPSATSNAATAAAAKIVLGAAGVTPQALSEQKSIEIGGAKIKVKRPAFIQPIGNMMKAFSASFRTKTSALKIDEEKSYRKPGQSPEPKLETIPSPRSQSLPPVGGGAAKVTTKTTTTTSTFTVKTSFAGVNLGSKNASLANLPSGTASPMPAVSPTASFVSAPTAPTPAPITGSTSPGASGGKGV